MKILYFAQERRAARLAGRALRQIVPDLRLSWARKPDAALGWIRDNPDARAVIVDAADAGSPLCEVLLTQVRDLALDTPIAVLAPDHLVGLSSALRQNLDTVIEEERKKREALEARRVEQDAALARTGRVCTALQERLLDLEAAVRAAAERDEAQTAATERLARHEAELEAAVAEATAVRGGMEARLAEAERTRQETSHRHTLELASLRADRAEREAKHDAALARANRLGLALQERLLTLEEATQTADRRHAADAAAIERLTIREGELGAALADAVAMRSALQHRLSDAETLARRATADLAVAGQRCIALEQQVAKEATGRAVLEQRFGDAESAHRDVERQHDAERAVLAERLAEAERQRGTLAEEVEAGGRDLASVRQELDGLRRQLAAMRTHSAALRRQAGRVSLLEQQIDALHKKNRRQFERAPYGLLECTGEGSVTRLNHALARLLGYRGRGDLGRSDPVETIFESPADFRWLVEQTGQTGAAASVETALRTRDHRRLFVRLHSALDEGAMLIAVEDLTKLSAVEQRLREAERMEAVGRVASEVATTCDTLLREVSQDGRQWLDRFERDALVRQQGELLLGDVTRAAGFLRQFVVYGRKQITNVEPVSLQQVLRDLKPVLKRVLGDDIMLLLPKTVDRFEVDVDAERIERILVHLANYARERMPHGGRVRVQLAAAIVDSRFLASHPKVRPGAHVLMTITEIQGAVWPALPVPLRIIHPRRAEETRPVLDNPGMDLGPLVALISDLGGHFWMSAEPAGNMTLQIHLPTRTRDDVESSEASWSGRSRHLPRWFRH